MVILFFLLVQCLLSVPEFNHTLQNHTGRLNFQKFDISKVLENGSYLMGSEGREYDAVEEDSGNNT